jgi:hypothetical protein
VRRAGLTNPLQEESTMFEAHEKSHADEVFAAKFGALAQMCSEA